MIAAQVILTVNGLHQNDPLLSNNFDLPNYQYIIVYRYKFIFVGQDDEIDDFDGDGGDDDTKPLHLPTDSDFC